MLSYTFDIESIVAKAVNSVRRLKSPSGNLLFNFRTRGCKSRKLRKEIEIDCMCVHSLDYADIQVAKAANSVRRLKLRLDELVHEFMVARATGGASLQYVLSELAYEIEIRFDWIEQRIELMERC